MQWIPDAVRGNWGRVRPLFHRLYVYRAHVSIALGVSLALVATGQLRETMIVNAEFVALRLAQIFPDGDPEIGG